MAFAHAGIVLEATKLIAIKSAITVIKRRPDVLFCGEHQLPREKLGHLHHEAHEACFIANSVKSEVRRRFMARSRPVAE